jgi:hypothetical protein
VPCGRWRSANERARLLDGRADHRPRRRAERSVNGLLDIAGKVAGNTANIPQLEATAPVLAMIVDEAVVQDGYMNALTDGFGDRS